MTPGDVVKYEQCKSQHGNSCFHCQLVLYTQHFKEQEQYSRIPACIPENRLEVILTWQRRAHGCLCIAAEPKRFLENIIIISHLRYVRVASFLTPHNSYFAPSHVILPIQKSTVSEAESHSSPFCGWGCLKHSWYGAAFMLRQTMTHQVVSNLPWTPADQNPSHLCGAQVGAPRSVQD